MQKVLGNQADSNDSDGIHFFSPWCFWFSGAMARNAVAISHIAMSCLLVKSLHPGALVFLSLGV